jgi:DNA-binding NarL/FixJ family response regulator
VPFIATPGPSEGSIDHSSREAFWHWGSGVFHGKQFGVIPILGNLMQERHPVADSSEFEQLAVGGPFVARTFSEADTTAAAVIAGDSSPGGDVDLGLCWRELIGGVVSVQGGIWGGARCGLLLRPPLPQGAPVTGRRLEILESVLSGAGQNCIAIDMVLAPSTVALHARQGLESLGVSGRPSRVHPLLMLMATAARRGILVSGKVSYVQSEQGELRLIEVPRPGQRLGESLPGAERAVIELLIEGDCYVEIAKKRRTSVRTVANQIASSFRRLNVSGRSELIQRLFVVDGLLPPGATPRSTPPSATLSPPTVPERLSGPQWDARSSGIRPLTSLSPQLMELAAAARAR